MVFQYTKNDQGHYVCGVCGDIKEKQNTMHYHLQKHEGKMPHSCTHCQKRFYQKYALDDHIKLRHSTSPSKSSIKCTFDGCISTFHKKEHCRIHIARNHLKTNVDQLIKKNKESKIHTCDNCKKEFNSYPAILYHVMDHMKETTDPVLKTKLTVF